MIEFTVSTLLDHLIYSLADWAKRENIEHEFVPYSGCVVYKMESDDFNSFMYEYFLVKVGA